MHDDVARIAKRVGYAQRRLQSADSASMEKREIEAPVDNSESLPPSMLSADFHWRFFPALLKSRFGNRAAESKTSFVAASFMQCVVVLFGAIAAAFAGVAFFPDLVGWLLLALSAAGVVYVLAVSIIEARGITPTYACFLFPLFFFCLALGFAAGVITGLGASTSIRIVCAGAGLALGYWTGLLAGLYGQRIGFFAVLLYPFALAGTAGILFTTIVLLST